MTVVRPSRSTGGLPPKAVFHGTICHAERLPFNVKVRGRSSGICEAQTGVSRNRLTADLFCDALS
jgi:hypothetical protein